MKLAALIASIFISVSAFPTNKLINGKPVDKSLYPEVVRILSCDNEGGFCAGCSASVIAPDVVLTAAHCMGKSNSIEFKYQKKKYVGDCKIHPEYKSVEVFDMAVCKLEKPVDLKYAIISKEGPQIDDDVTLIGYGCTVPRDRNGNGGGEGGNDGILRVGNSRVYKLPTRHPRIDNWFYTYDDAALCYGDSGGPVFIKVEDPNKDYHYVIGVNSMADIRKKSLLTAIYLDRGISFLEDFEASYDVEICGLSKICK